MSPLFARPAISTRSRVQLGLGAAALAAIPLILSLGDGDRDLDPFFAALVVAAVAVAILPVLAPANAAARLVSWLIVTAWFGAAAMAAFLLVMHQTACGCSTPDLSSFPPAPTYAGLTATAFHLLATYGGGVLVAAAVVLPGPARTAEPPA